MASDEDILDYVFDSGLSGAPINKVEDELISKIIKDAEKLPIDAEKLKELQGKEVEAVHLAETEKQFDKSLELLTNLIKESNNLYSSAFNNRAQIYLMKNELDLAEADLNEAIRIATRFGELSILRQAYTQRGILRKRQNRDDEALNDFNLGSRFGNRFAKIQSIQLNPYSAMCNQAMEEIIRMEQSKKAKDT